MIGVLGAIWTALFFGDQGASSRYLWWCIAVLVIVLLHIAYPTILGWAAISLPIFYYVGMAWYLAFQELFSAISSRDLDGELVAGFVLTALLTAVAALVGYCYPRKKQPNQASEPTPLARRGSP